MYVILVLLRGKLFRVVSWWCLLVVCFVSKSWMRHVDSALILLDVELGDRNSNHHVLMR